MGNYSSKQAYEPHELDALKQVFDELTSQAWFDPSEEAKEAFAKYLFETFPADTFDPKKHRLIVETSARMFYSHTFAS